MDDSMIFHDKSATEEAKYKVNFAAKDVDKLRIMQKDTVNQVASLLGKTSITLAAHEDILNACIISHQTPHFDHLITPFLLEQGEAH